MKSRVFACVLTYQEIASAAATVESVRDQVEEVVVICNACKSPETQQQASGFELITNTDNKSFSECVNQAAELAQSRGYTYLLFLTNDVTLETGSVLRMSAALDAQEVLAAVGPVHLRASNPEEIYHGGGEFNSSKWQSSIRLGGQPKSSLPEDEITQVAWLDGGCILIRLNGFLPWRPEYGFYWEDVDWGLQNAIQKRCLAVCNKVFAIHDVSKTTGKYSLWKHYQICRGRMLCAKMILEGVPRNIALEQLRVSGKMRMFSSFFSLKSRLRYAAYKDAMNDRGLPEHPMSDDDPRWKEILARK